jgi:hypothetical protein
MSSSETKQKGRILKVKKGYNPNSSSIGSDIMAFLILAGGAGIFSVILSNTLDSIKKIINKNKDKLETS